MRWSEPKRQHQALTLLGLSADRPAEAATCQIVSKAPAGIESMPAEKLCFSGERLPRPLCIFRPLNMIDAALAFLNRQLPFPLDESSFAACAAVFSVVVALLAIRLSSKPGGSTHQF